MKLTSGFSDFSRIFSNIVGAGNTPIATAQHANPLSTPTPKPAHESPTNRTPRTVDRFEKGAAKTDLPTSAQPKSPLHLLAAHESAPSSKACTKIILEPGKYYMDQVPIYYREHIMRLAKDSFSPRTGISLAAFTEKMAHCWLLKFAEFKRIVEASGFHEIQDSLDKNTSAAVFALTMSGSFIAATEPDQNGKRSSAYIRINIRKPNQIEPFKRGTKFNHPIRKGDPISLDNHINRTSPVIAVFASSADAEMVRVVTETIQDSFIDVEHQTIYNKDK